MNIICMQKKMRHRIAILAKLSRDVRGNFLNGFKELCALESSENVYSCPILILSCVKRKEKRNQFNHLQLKVGRTLGELLLLSTPISLELGKHNHKVFRQII